MNFLQKLILTSAAMGNINASDHAIGFYESDQSGGESIRASKTLDEIMVTRAVPGYLSQEMSNFIKPEMFKEDKDGKGKTKEIVSKIVDGNVENDLDDLEKLSSLFSDGSMADGLVPIGLYFAQENIESLVPGGPSWTATGTYKVTFGATDQSADVDG